MSGRARLIMWAALFIAAIVALVVLEDHFPHHGVCDDIHGGCPGVTPTATR